MVEQSQTDVTTCPKLICLSASCRGQGFRLDNPDKKEVTIGRNDDCDFIVSDSTVSGCHCVITRVSDHAINVIDQKSTNKSFVNGRQINPGEVATLKTGDILRIGNVELLFDDEEVRSQSSKDSHTVVFFEGNKAQSVVGECENLSPFKRRWKAVFEKRLVICLKIVIYSLVAACLATIVHCVLRILAF